MDVDSGEENEAGIDVHPIHEAELNKFKLVKEDIIILQDHRKEWQDSKGSARTSIAMKAYEEMLKRDPGLKQDTLKAKEARKLKRQGVQWWLHTYGRKRKSIERFYYVKRWTYRMVIAQRYPQIHQDMVDKLSANARNGSATYMRFYQKALSKVIKKLEPGEILDAKETAKRWNTMGPPHHVQAKTAHKHATTYVKDFARQMKISCGMDCLVLSFHLDEGKNIIIESREYMAELGGSSFFRSVKDWNKIPIEGALYEHAKTMYQEGGDSMFRSSKSITARKDLIQFDEDEAGYPLLPEPQKMDMKLQDKKEMIRSFITWTYRNDSGSHAAVVPWKSLANEMSNYIDPKYMPQELLMDDPSHLRIHSVNGLLSHWYKRQEKGLPVLRFRQVLQSGELEPVTGIQNLHRKSTKEKHSRKRVVNPNISEDQSSDESEPTLPKPRPKPQTGNTIRPNAGAGPRPRPGPGVSSSNFVEGSSRHPSRRSTRPSGSLVPVITSVRPVPVALKQRPETQNGPRPSRSPSPVYSPFRPDLQAIIDKAEKEVAEREDHLPTVKIKKRPTLTSSKVLRSSVAHRRSPRKRK